MPGGFLMGGCGRGGEAGLMGVTGPRELEGCRWGLWRLGGQSMLNVSREPARERELVWGHFRSCWEKLLLGPNREARRITRKPGAKRVIRTKRGGCGPH